MGHASADCSLDAKPGVCYYEIHHWDRQLTGRQSGRIVGLGQQRILRHNAHSVLQRLRKLPTELVLCQLEIFVNCGDKIQCLGF